MFSSMEHARLMGDVSNSNHYPNTQHPNHAKHLNEAMAVRRLLGEMSERLTVAAVQQHHQLEYINQQITVCEKNAQDLLDRVSRMTGRINRLTRCWKITGFQAT